MSEQGCLGCDGILAEQFADLRLKFLCVVCLPRQIHLGRFVLLTNNQPNGIAARVTTEYRHDLIQHLHVICLIRRLVDDDHNPPTWPSVSIRPIGAIRAGR